MGGRAAFLGSLKGKQRGLVIVAGAVACSSANSEPQAGERLCVGRDFCTIGN